MIRNSSNCLFLVCIQIILLFLLTDIPPIFAADIGEGPQGYCNLKGYNDAECGKDVCCFLSTTCNSQFCYSVGTKQYWSVPSCYANCSSSPQCDNSCGGGRVTTPTPMPTPTPTICPLPSSPQNLVARCPNPGNNANLSWNAVSGVSHYPLRVDDLANGWTGTCSNVNPGDICLDNSSTSYSFSSVPGHTYHWWVNSYNSCGWGNASDGGNFTCVSNNTPTPTNTPVPTNTPFPTNTPVPTNTPFPTSTPTLSLSCNITGNSTIRVSSSTTFSGNTTYTGLHTLNYEWTASCLSGILGVSRSLFFTASSIGNCTLFLKVSELGGVKTAQCNLPITVTDLTGGTVSGYVLLDDGSNQCSYDSSDHGLNGRTVTLYDANMLNPTNITTINNSSNGQPGYFEFTKPSGQVYNLVYTLASGEDSIHCIDTVNISYPHKDAATHKLLYTFNLPDAGLTNKIFYIDPMAIPPSGAWLQTKDGDVHSNSDYKINIPGVAYPFSMYLVSGRLKGNFLYTGGNWEYPDDGTINERASQQKWYIPNYNDISYLAGNISSPFFDYFTTDSPAQKNLDPTVNDLTQSEVSSDLNQIVMATPSGGTLSVTSPISLPNTNDSAIYYIDGDLKLDSSIKTGTNSVAVFVISGDLKIKSNVTLLDGVYFVDGTISTTDDVSVQTQLVVNGMMYTSSSGKMFTMTRDLGSANSTTPAEKFIFQPKYLLNTNLQEVFGKKKSTWQEIPG